MAMKTFDIIAVVLMVFVLLVNSFNILQMQEMKSGRVMAAQQDNIAGMATQQSSFSPSGIDILPKGIPAIYGAELGASYDDVSASDQKKADATINKLGVLDQQIKLSGADKERYIAIASQISCEYCCGVESIIFKDGSAACSCQHSFAMRGIAKYLIKNHPAEFTDERILEELSKWKILFFPSQMAAKAQVLKSKGIELNYINLASNKYRGVENGN